MIDPNGVFHNNVENTSTTFVRFYQALLGTSVNFSKIDLSLLKDGGFILNIQASPLVFPVSTDEIRDALFSMSSNKSPGTDGFSPGFYKHY